MIPAGVLAQGRVHRLSHLGAAIPTVIGLGSALAIWWALAASGLVPPENLPAPSAVFDRGLQMLTQPFGTETLLGHAAISTYRVGMGFLLGCGVGTVLGFLMEFMPGGRATIGYLLSLLRPLPPFTLIAVFIVWFGLGEAAKIALIFFGVFARMAIYAAAAVHAPPVELLEAARTLGARKFGLFWAVTVPAAVPDILVGMRVLLPVAWDSVMAAEIIGANSGLGWAIWTGARNLQTDVIFVCMLAIAVLGYLSDVLVTQASRLLTGDWAARLGEEQ